MRAAALNSWGMSAERWEATRLRVADAGRADGLAIDMDGVLSIDSRPAHRLVKLAVARGITPDRVWDRAFSGHLERREDLADPATPARLLGAVNDDLGPVTALVLSHSHSVDSSILDTTLESWDAHYAVNVRAAWLAIKAFAEQLPPVDLLDDGARIVALTSDHVVHNLPYGSSKGALDRLVVAAARTAGRRGLTLDLTNLPDTAAAAFRRAGIAPHDPFDATPAL